MTSAGISAETGLHLSTLQDQGNLRTRIPRPLLYVAAT